MKRLVDEYAKLSKQISQETKEKDTIKEVLIVDKIKKIKKKKKKLLI